MALFGYMALAMAFNLLEAKTVAPKLATTEEKERQELTGRIEQEYGVVELHAWSGRTWSEDPEEIRVELFEELDWCKRGGGRFEVAIIISDRLLIGPSNQDGPGDVLSNLREQLQPGEKVFWQGYGYLFLVQSYYSLEISDQAESKKFGEFPNINRLVVQKINHYFEPDPL